MCWTLHMTANFKDYKFNDSAGFLISKNVDLNFYCVAENRIINEMSRFKPQHSISLVASLYLHRNTETWKSLWLKKSNKFLTFLPYRYCRQRHSDFSFHYPFLCLLLLLLSARLCWFSLPFFSLTLQYLIYQA